MANFWQLKPIHSFNLFIDDSVKHGYMWKSTKVMALLIHFIIKSIAANGPSESKLSCTELEGQYEREALQGERNSIDRGLQGRSSLLGIGVSSS